MMTRTLLCLLTAAATAGALAAPTTTTAPASRPAIDAKHLRTARADVEAGVAFLLSKRNPDGGWGFAPGVSDAALTAMALKVLVRHPRYDNDSAEVKAGFAALLKHRGKDGGFADPRGGSRNYYTSVAVMALAAAKNPRHKAALDGAVRFLRGLQIAAGSRTPSGRKVGKNDPFEGGVSYGEHGRPDLSNLGMWMDALREAGVKGDDPAMQRALGFVKRLQNRTEGTEGQSFVPAGTNDGGFIYAVDFRGGRFVGESKAGSGRRGLRSYGSMTYTGFKSMLYADVGRKDPRVRAAFDWVRKYWRLDTNPNMPEASSREGLYYYYHVFAKALRAWGRDVITDTRGVRHNWRHELIDALHERKTAQGFWVNTATRWFEANPILATCYATLALQEALGR